MGVSMGAELMSGDRFLHDVWRFGGVEIAGDEVIVDHLACPGVNGGIMLLINCEFGRFPVGESLIFGDSLLENDAEDALETVVGDFVVFDKRLEFYESFGIEIGQFGKRVEIVFDGKTYFLDVGALEETEQGV